MQQAQRVSGEPRLERSEREVAKEKNSQRPTQSPNGNSCILAHTRYTQDKFVFEGKVIMDIQWFVEPYGKRADYTNEVIANMLRERDESPENAFELHKKVLVLGQGGIKYLTKKRLCAVPEYAFITELSGKYGVTFRRYKRVGDGQIEQVDFDALQRAQRKAKEKDKRNMAKVRLAEDPTP